MQSVSLPCSSFYWQFFLFRNQRKTKLCTLYIELTQSVTHIQSGAERTGLVTITKQGPEYMNVLSALIN